MRYVIAAAALVGLYCLVEVFLDLRRKRRDRQCNEHDWQEAVTPFGRITKCSRCGDTDGMLEP